MLWMTPIPDDYHEEIRRTVLMAWVDALMALAADADAAPIVRATSEAALAELAGAAASDELRQDAFFGRWLGRRITRFLDRNHDEAADVTPPTPPPGSPIGQ